MIQDSIELTGTTNDTRRTFIHVPSLYDDPTRAASSSNLHQMHCRILESTWRVFSIYYNNHNVKFIVSEQVPVTRDHT